MSESLTALNAISPVDGRYTKQTAALAPLCSEAGIIRLRMHVMVEWMFEIVPLFPNRTEWSQQASLNALITIRQTFQDEDVVQIKETEVGVPANGDQPAKQGTNHDVKAVEYWLRQQFSRNGALEPYSELLHFGCTSEDVNNIVHALQLKRGRNVLHAEIGKIVDVLDEFAKKSAKAAMLAHTHGQPATPTTMGKEFRIFFSRVARAAETFRCVPIYGKMNGASGNYNAAMLARPDVDWEVVAKRVVSRHGLEWQEYTTQIEPHDYVAEYCDALARLNTVLISFCQDVWWYISVGYLRQKMVEGEVGSSTMPNKVNPIDFENAEANLRIAVALLRQMADKLPVSRWQRDLTDSSTLRNIGVMLGHSLIAYKAVLRGLGKIEVDEGAVAADLDAHWEVLAEAVQTVMRAENIPGGYEVVKSLTRGQKLTKEGYLELVGQLPISDNGKAKLSALTPATYIGKAEELALRR